MKDDFSRLLGAARTERQKEVAKAYIKHNGHCRNTAKALGISHQSVSLTIKNILRSADEVSPEFDRPSVPGFSTKRISTAKQVEFEDGTKGYQWHVQERDRETLEELQDTLKEVFSDIPPCKPIKPPTSNETDLAAFYIIGDHHFGMYAWSEETGGDDYDTDISERLLIDATRKLVARSPASEHGYLINLGDFLHANDSTSQTPASKHALDTDGRMGRVARQAGMLIKTLAELMLSKHKTVHIINSRGNHDPDASMWLNEVCRAYFLNEPRVVIHDNYSKFTKVTFGKNLVVTHHGDKLNWQRMFEWTTRNLGEDWGTCRYRFGWTGHLHHEASQEIGGMKFERFGVLAPPDAWHAGSGYGAARSMTCKVLHKEYGEDITIKVGVNEL